MEDRSEKWEDDNVYDKERPLCAVPCRVVGAYGSKPDGGQGAAPQPGV